MVIPASAPTCEEKGSAFEHPCINDSTHGGEKDASNTKHSPASVLELCLDEPASIMGRVRPRCTPLGIIVSILDSRFLIRRR